MKEPKFVNLPIYGKCDINNLPVDFEEKIKEAFLKFTEGTSKDFRFLDKLRFIDLCVEGIREREKYGEDAVKRFILDNEEYMLDEYGELPDRDEYWSLEFMGRIYEHGVESATLRGDCCSDGYAVERAIMRILYAVIEVS